MVMNREPEERYDVRRGPPVNADVYTTREALKMFRNSNFCSRIHIGDVSRDGLAGVNVDGRVEHLEDADKMFVLNDGVGTRR